MEINKHELDRYITGNWGEDGVDDDDDEHDETIDWKVGDRATTASGEAVTIMSTRDEDAQFARVLYRNPTGYEPWADLVREDGTT